MRTLPLLSAVCHRPSGVVGASAGAAACCTGGATFATGAGAAGAAVATGARVSFVVGRPERRSRVPLSDTGAGGAGGTLVATGAGGGAGGGLLATGSGAGAG